MLGSDLKGYSLVIIIHNNFEAQCCCYASNLIIEGKLLSLKFQLITSFKQQRLEVEQVLHYLNIKTETTSTKQIEFCKKIKEQCSE